MHCNSKEDLCLPDKKADSIPLISLRVTLDFLGVKLTIFSLQRIFFFLARAIVLFLTRELTFQRPGYKSPTGCFCSGEFFSTLAITEFKEKDLDKSVPLKGPSQQPASSSAPWRGISSEELAQEIGSKRSRGPVAQEGKGVMLHTVKSPVYSILNTKHYLVVFQNQKLI